MVHCLWCTITGGKSGFMSWWRVCGFDGGFIDERDERGSVMVGERLGG